MSEKLDKLKEEWVENRENHSVSSAGRAVSSRLPKGKELQDLANEYAEEQNHELLGASLQKDISYIDKHNCIKIVSWLIKKGF